MSHFLRESIKWILTIVFAIVLALGIKGFLFEFVRVDGESMLDTLQDGDIMLVTKYDYGSFWLTGFWQSPLQQELASRWSLGQYKIGLFDVVIVRYPGEGLTNFVKRIVGRPGDRISLKDSYLYINGERQEEQYVASAYRSALYNVYCPVDMEEFIVPASGDEVVFVFDQNNPYGWYLQINGHVWNWLDVASDLIDEYGNVVTISNDGIYWNHQEIDYSKMASLLDHPFFLREDLYFVMGDHRNDSSDSRIIGPVARSDIMGHVRRVIFPFDRWSEVN